MNIGARIKQLRELRGLTLEQVGDSIGVNKATVQRYETGKIDIKRTVAMKLAEILNTNPSYILGWTDCSAPDRKGFESLKVVTPTRIAIESALDKLNEDGEKKVRDYAEDLVSSGRYEKVSCSKGNPAKAV